MSKLFYRLDTDVASRTNLSPAAKLVYAVIATRIGQNGLCWPSICRLSKDVGLAERTVGRAIRQLASCGLVETIRHGRGKVNNYRLIQTRDKMSLVEEGHTRDKTSGELGTKCPPNRKEKRTLTAPAAQSQGKPLAEKKRKGGKKAPPDARVKPLFDSFCRRFEAVKKTRYIAAHARDLSILKTLLSAVGGDDAVGEIERAIDAMLADSWGRQHASVPLLSKQINTWLGAKSGFNPAPGTDFRQYDSIGSTYE